MDDKSLSSWLGGFSCLQLLIAYEDMFEFLVPQKHE